MIWSRGPMSSSERWHFAFSDTPDRPLCGETAVNAEVQGAGFIPAHRCQACHMVFLEITDTVDELIERTRGPQG